MYGQAAIALSLALMGGYVSAPQPVPDNTNPPSIVEIQEDTNLPNAEQVQKINQYVNGLIDYGIGPLVDGRATTEEEILEFGEGNCGMYAYLLVKELSRHGYNEAVIYGITSQYIGEGTANHAVVEVETTDGTYVYDPTHGIYYTTDLDTLITSGNAEAYACGEPSMETYYLNSRFFAEASNISVYLDGRNNSDFNLLNWYEASVHSGIPVRVNPSQDIVYDADMDDNSIICQFEEEVEFYRIEIGFMEKLQGPVSIECWAVNANGTKTKLEGQLVQDIYGLSYQTTDEVSTLEVVVEINGNQPLPMLAFFDMYQ